MKIATKALLFEARQDFFWEATYQEQSFIKKTVGFGGSKYKCQNVKSFLIAEYK